MSTLPGQASKGEKTKSKFQSLDINSLYRVSRGENLEKQQQKSSSIYIKHGMQSLGKVPNARRAPANLPSLKAEHSGSDAAVPLVPPGAPGWGKQDAPQPPSTPPQAGQSQNGAAGQPATVSQQAQAQVSAHQAAAALPVTNAIPHPHKQPSPSSAQPAPVDKLWSTVMSGHDSAGPHPPLYHSPQFRHEFPSLSAGEGGPARAGADAPQYPTGLSLRPQTEGSWTQGGQRPVGPHGVEMAGQGRPNSAHPGVPPQHSAQAGQQPQQHPFPPQMRGVMPSFMYKGSSFQPSPHNGAPGPHSGPPPANGRPGPRTADGRSPRPGGPEREAEEAAPRPIIKEEELTRMDEIGKDMGWAESDEIDYNQKLAFSDDESDRNAKKESKRHHSNRDQKEERSESHGDGQSRQWGGSRSNTSRGRSSEEEDIWMQRRNQTDKEVEIAVQRAKQRKEEEEKRFQEERKQAAAKKLMELEQKIQKRDRDGHEGVATINPVTVPPKPINHVDIPLPNFQKDKEPDRDQRERDSRSRTPNEPAEDKNQPQGNSFRQLAQIQGKNFPPRKHVKLSDNREQNAPNFSRHFQNDLPPRFLKQHNNNTNSNLQNQQQQYHQQQQFDNRWSSNNQNVSKHQQSNRNAKQDSPETEDHKDYVRQSSEDSYRSSHHSQQDSPPKSQDKTEKPTRKDKEEDKWQTNKEDKWQTNKEDKWQKEKMPERKQSKEDWNDHREKSREDWSDHREKNREEKQTDKYERERERPQRTDSRDSRSRDYMGAWSESPYEHPSSYEEKRRDHDRRVVPGPITKERIEADDMRNEKRNLTQLKRGQQVEVRSELKKLEEEKKEPQFVSAWADSIPPAIEELQAKKQAEEKKHLENLQKLAEPKKQDKSEDYNRNKPYGQKKGWGNAPTNDYQSSRGQPWQNRRPPSRSRRQYHGTDSDGSMDDHHQKTDARNDTQKSEATDQKSPKPMRKNDKEDRSKPEKFVGDQRKPEKKDNYVPRGEPSRHGRGGGNFRSGRMGSISKKIDGYGPPPAKSPFGGHHEEKETKKPSEDAPTVDNPASVEDKIKQNQQALAAGIIGKRSEPVVDDKSKQRPKPDLRKSKPKSEEADKGQGGKLPNSRPAAAQPRGRNNPPARSGDKRYDAGVKQPVAKKDDAQAALASAISDITLVEDKEEARSVNGDSEGFQEVKSKKAVKERQKSSEDKPKPTPKVEPVKDSKPERERERERDRKGKMTQQLTQQQIQNIPSLMATPVNPPPVLPQTKSGFDRGRQTAKLPPRLAKQKLQKQAMQQQQQHGGDMGEANKGANLYGAKEPTQAPACAWDKPLVTQLRGMEHESMLGAAMEAARGAEAGHSPVQLGGGGGEKMLGKQPVQPSDKPLLDGSSAPVNTIIFENTNFKSAPGSRGGGAAPPRPEKARGKPDEPDVEMQAFGKAGGMGELLQGKGESKSDAIQLPLFKEDGVDMKLDFFSADLQFGDDKTSKNFVSKSIHAMTSGNNTVDTLDIKIASVKKVWETSEQEGEDTQITFGGAPLDSNVFNQSKDGSEDNHEVYSPSPSQTAQANVCKVKPTQQVSGGAGVGQPALGGSGGHQQPHNMAQAAAGLMGHPLSPPPAMQAVLGAGVGMGPPYTANQHIGYQTGLSGSTQYGISAIPSPPTVPLVYNSSQQLQNAVQTAAGLYGAFQLDQLSGQGSYSSRSQFSQYANYHGLGQTASSPYSAPSVYLPTPPHPPPPAAQAPPPGPPPPELYQNMNSFRLSAQTPFGQSQQLSNPTTVLISSTSNSLMSASVKPSGQQISAIGTKAGGVGQAYQQQSQQGQQVFMTYDPSIQANYLASNAGVMQRAAVGPAQNNVVPGLQPSSSYYSGSTGGQTGFFQQAANSSMPSAQQLSQHQAGYGLQGNVFGQHAQSHANAPLPSYNSHFLTTPMQVAAALSAQQQYRSGLPAAAYLKGVGVGGQGQAGEQSQGGRSQQLKSPGSQEVLSSVFNSGPQIPSPKSRQNMKHPPQQSSPTSQHKYNMYQGVGGPQNMNMQRYPTPIQRPINFQQMQQNSVNQKHRNNTNNKPPNNRYYSNQNHSLSGQSEKCDDEKMNDNGTGNVKNNAAVSVDKVKDNIKEEPGALKD